MNNRTKISRGRAGPALTGICFGGRPPPCGKPVRLPKRSNASSLALQVVAETQQSRRGRPDASHFHWSGALRTDTTRSRLLRTGCY